MPINHWVLTGGIDYFSIATCDHVNSLGFDVRISPRANPEDRVVVDRVLIGGHVGLSIGSVVAGCLTTALNVVVEFLRPRGNPASASRPLMSFGD
jgi:hypothetical protein